MKSLEKGTCWSSEKLADALGAKGFAAWVEKYAGGDSARGDALRDDAAFAKEIDCAEPHSLELYNVVEVSPRLTDQVKEYADLLDQKSDLYRQIRDEVNDRCMAGSAYGVAQRKAGGMPVQLGPTLNVDGGFHVAWDPFPADLWEKGQHQFVCTFEQDEPGTISFADVTTEQAADRGAGLPEHPGQVPPLQRQAPGRGHRRDGAQHRHREGPDQRQEGDPHRLERARTSRSATRSTPSSTRSARRCSPRSRP